MHAKYKVSISYDSKVMAKVRVFPIESQTDRQDKNKMPRIYSFRAHKKYDNVNAKC